MTISAKVVEHSRHYLYTSTNEDITAPRDLVTFELTYPRFVHAEVMTHRLFSRNASSSRAIPVSRMIQNILDNPAMPIHWGKNQPGMQADEETDALIYGEGLDFLGLTPEQAWLEARDRAVEMAQAFHKAGYHKQVVNRILEPFMHISVIVTATDFDNFFWLRRHPDAQPEIKALADAMWDALQASTPRTLIAGDWHLPYITAEERAQHELWVLLQMSSARCARVSYLTHDGKKPTMEQDTSLYERLVGGAPLHASPTEHQARCDHPIYLTDTLGWEAPQLSGNFDEGYIQHRKTLRGEWCKHYEPEAA